MAKPRSAAVPEDVPILASELPFAHFGMTATIAGYLLYSFVLAASIHLFFTFTGGHDPLAIPLLRSGLLSVDMWSFVHVINFAVVGMVFPNRMMGMLLYGIAWVC